MKKQFILLLSTLSSFVLNGTISEIKHITELKKYLCYPQNTLMIFDIDNTIIESSSTDGSDQWFYAAIAYFQDQGLTYKEAYNKVMPLYLDSNKKNGVKLVEKEIVELIQAFQKKGMLIIALTARSEPIKLTTVDQLNKLEIDFSKNEFNGREITFKHKIPASFYKGILFCGDNNKGTILQDFLKQTNYKPSSIVFVDDKEFYLSCVEHALKETRIPFIGLRYSYLDHKVNNFQFNQEMLFDSKLCRSILSI